jgi:hypothetical protein
MARVVNSIDINIHEQSVLIEQTHRVVILVHGTAAGPYPDLIAQKIRILGVLVKA